MLWKGSEYASVCWNDYICFQAEMKSKGSIHTAQKQYSLKHKSSRDTPTEGQKINSFDKFFHIFTYKFIFQNNSGLVFQLIK